MAFTVTLTDQDPDGLMPTHWWGVSLAYPERPDENKPGGTWNLSAPGEAWARILESGLSNLTEQQVFGLVDMYTP